LCFLSGLSGAEPEAGQLAAALLFDQLQGRREGDTTLSQALITAKFHGRQLWNCRFAAIPQFQHFCNKRMIAETLQSLALPKR
jgi:hypothetical protein